MSQNEMSDDQITRIAKRVIEMLAEQQATQARVDKALNDEYASALNGVYARYPFLDPHHVDARPVVIEEALAMTNRMIEAGTRNVDAMLAAVAQIAPKYDALPLH
ncbi:hypothetical protein KDX38_10445 [Pseudomonas sp. CDFA 602]|uniref:hypothetical protein n=1 Tax=Pseudomonas californiensis TaxID=2829823 RepID=UPI001E57301E|nr:hypothetical protein [Pseudomonas californiensis]MCD5993860.1 hypothetical protein [Pseudomonas californiensis]MCD5999637.1 hypothetical protein [Pseudomonas californiensis]